MGKIVCFNKIDRLEDQMHEIIANADMEEIGDDIVLDPISQAKIRQIEIKIVREMLHEGYTPEQIDEITAYWEV